MADTPFAVRTGSTTALTQNRVLRNTYLLLAISLIPTVVGALVGMNINFSFMRASPIMASLVIIGVFYGWIYAIERNRDSSLGVGLLLGFTFFLGLLLAPLLQSVLRFGNGGSLIALAAGGTAAVFFAMAGIATNSKRDFSSMGKFLVAGVVVAMVLVVANIFFQSSAVHLAILAIFIPLCSMLILFHINQVVRGGETNYVSAALGIYIAVYNLFSALLQMLGIFGGRDE
jgi:FtsH-binding integral membrane protein